MPPIDAFAQALDGEQLLRPLGRSCAQTRRKFSPPTPMPALLG